MKILKLAILAATALPLALPVGALAEGPARFGDSRVFATVPDPGNPEEIVVDGNTVYVGTTVGGDGAVIGDGKPSKIFAFDTRTGEQTNEITVEGEDVNALHGIAGLAVDRSGRLYAASVSHGILRFDIPSGSQSLYAPLPDLPPCLLASAPCSPTPEDRAPLGNGITFDEDGYLYVADSFQAVIFRIPPGGGEAEVWFADERLHGFFGANGIKISPDRSHVYFSVTGDLQQEGYVYRLPNVESPSPADLEVFHAFGGGQPDGIAFGRSGRLHVVLGSGAVAILDKDGTIAHQLTSEHFYNPSSIAFDGRGNGLVTNHAFFDLDPAHQTIVQLRLDDPGLRLPKPKIP